MLLRSKCPGCGDLKEYVAEQVGSETDCRKCGRRFELKLYRGYVARQVISTTLAVLVVTGSVIAHFCLRDKRSDLRSAAPYVQCEGMQPHTSAADQGVHLLEPAVAAP